MSKHAPLSRTAPQAAPGVALGSRAQIAPSRRRTRRFENFSFSGRIAREATKGRLPSTTRALIRRA
jgi:hypothetical protein